MGKKLTTEEFIEKAKKLHNDRYDYSQTVYVNSRAKIIVICPEHGPFEQRASSHLAGCGCPECAKIWTDEHRQNLQKSSRKFRGMTMEEWIARAKDVHGNKYDYSQAVYVNSRTDIKIICPKHGLFEQKANSHLRGFGCKLCGFESDNRKGVHSWSDAQREKIANTCREKYGADRYLDSRDGREKIANIKSTSEFRNKMSHIISSDVVQQKTKNTCFLKYGVDSAMKLSETVAKVGYAKCKNGTWRTSKPEEDMYDILCDSFGKDDVIRQYRDARYSFYCDFYIKSLDLFVELNATWLHGGHWFDETSVDDLNLLSVWWQKAKCGKRFYDVAIDVWTVRDVKKRQTAIKNNLNYVVFWKNDLSDFIEWLNSDSLVLNNI